VNRFVLHFGFAVLVQPWAMDGIISSFLSYDCVVDFPLDDGCRYDAHIVGTLSPVYGRTERGENVEPNFTISATLVCPRNAPLHVEQTLAHTGPLPRERVETLISHHATITHEDGDKRCLHVPIIRFRGENMIGTGVETYCTRPSY
jgi:hypothetical protein